MRYVIFAMIAFAIASAIYGGVQSVRAWRVTFAARTLKMRAD